MSSNQIRVYAHQLLQDWLDSCTRNKKLSRNTIAVGIVVLDHLMRKSPVKPDEVISPGKEIIGSRSKLHPILRSYGVKQPEKYLQEVTTRQAHPDGIRLFEIFQYGTLFAPLSKPEQKEILSELIQVLIEEINRWFERQHLKISFQSSNSPVEWIHQILEEAKGKSGGIVEQHLVGATLQVFHPEIEVSNLPGHAADLQTGRPGDFVIHDTVYHVTVAPGEKIIQKCSQNLKSNLNPVLLVPNALTQKTRSFAEYAGIEKQISVFGLEDFIALKIIDLAHIQRLAYLQIMQQIASIYNERVEAVETDMSLKIEIV